MHQRQGWQCKAALHQLPLRRFRLNFGERKRVIVPRFVAKRASRVTAFSTGKTVVHRIHQSRRRTEVGVQRVVPPGGGAAGLQIAVNVGTAKAVNRLFGVTNQEHCGAGVVVRHPVELVKNLVLQR